MGVQDRTLVGANGMRSIFQGHSDVSDGRLARFRIQGTGFEEDIGPGGMQPTGKLAGALGSRKITCQQLLWREALLSNQPAQPARGHARDAPVNAVAIGEFLPFAL